MIDGCPGSHGSLASFVSVFADNDDDEDAATAGLEVFPKLPSERKLEAAPGEDCRQGARTMAWATAETGSGIKHGNWSSSVDVNLFNLKLNEVDDSFQRRIILSLASDHQLVAWPIGIETAESICALLSMKFITMAILASL